MTVAGRPFKRKHTACPPERFMLINRRQNMFGSKRNKETERFYLLPGQGGAAFRRKQRYLLIWSIIVGLALAALLAVLMYFLNKPKL
jgi:hypothetical protein